ncbi:hypothetical protein BDR07DRAFT_583189 [Suillus spraguei]|nr:hypothetical protein BDR07DRAFT_681458 [Suillus spraguei]KAG2354893.1 hypothetical protein BDR07DRAFT_583189 [Suillus spraguei]
MCRILLFEIVIAWLSLSSASRLPANMGSRITMLYFQGFHFSEPYYVQHRLYALRSSMCSLAFCSPHRHCLATVSAVLTMNSNVIVTTLDVKGIWT